MNEWHNHSLTQNPSTSRERELSVAPAFPPHAEDPIKPTNLELIEQSHQLIEEINAFLECTQPNPSSDGHNLQYQGDNPIGSPLSNHHDEGASVHSKSTKHDQKLQGSDVPCSIR